jgi:peptidoglycan/xylan/chitin deacetylase (PgdA/CDA1 family)
MHRVPFAMSSKHPNPRRAALNLASGALWYFPNRFGLARLLGRRYSLRCVLFHDISAKESSFTRGLGITITPKVFENALKFLVKHYTPVSLQDVLSNANGRGLPARPVLVTFDDGYASVCEFAAPLCSKLGVPAVSFLNASCLDNRQLALDNLVCHVVNTLGMGTINAAARAVTGLEGPELKSLTEVFTCFLPAISPSIRSAFRAALVEAAGIDEPDLARDANLYMTSRQAEDLAAFNFEIGNHTYTHVNCRCLSRADFGRELDRNRAVLEELSGIRVRSFSVPYGSSADLTPDVAEHLEESGHEAVFLVESLANRKASHIPFYRVSVKASSDAALFSEIEILPRVRSIRNLVFGAATFRSYNRTSQLAH